MKNIEVITVSEKHGIAILRMGAITSAFDLNRLPKNIKNGDKLHLERAEINRETGEFELSHIPEENLSNLIIQINVLKRAITKSGVVGFSSGETVYLDKEVLPSGVKEKDYVILVKNS